MYRRQKKLLQPSGKHHFMHLSREYYTLDYRNYKDMSEFLNHVKSSEEQIDATNVEMTPINWTLLCLTMVLSNESHYRSPLQIWDVTKDMTAEKAREMLWRTSKDSKQNLEHHQRWWHAATVTEVQKRAVVNIAEKSDTRNIHVRKSIRKLIPHRDTLEEKGAAPKKSLIGW